MLILLVFHPVALTPLPPQEDLNLPESKQALIYRMPPEQQWQMVQSHKFSTARAEENQTSASEYLQRLKNTLEIVRLCACYRIYITCISTYSPIHLFFTPPCYVFKLACIPLWALPHPPMLCAAAAHVPAGRGPVCGRARADARAPRGRPAHSHSAVKAA